MRPRDIPPTVQIRNDIWRIIWRSRRDPSWVAEGAWGVTIHSKQEIHLCESMKHQPHHLQTVWIHELLHACIPLLVKDGRPSKFTSGMEEEVVYEIAPLLALLLNQTGWRRP